MPLGGYTEVLNRTEASAAHYSYVCTYTDRPVVGVSVVGHVIRVGDSNV